MSLLYAIGGALVTRDELEARASEVKAFDSAIAGGDHDAQLMLSSGVAKPDNTLTARTAEIPANELYPVGIGKPLLIRVKAVYPGRFSSSPNRRDAVVTSAMKGIEVYDGAPRAINYIEEFESRQPMTVGNATRPGTPVIFYSHALTELESSLTIDIAFDDFDEQALQYLGNAVKTAAGIPIFAPASGYLIAGAMVINLIRVIGKALYDSKFEFTETKALRLDRPADFENIVDYRVFMKKKHHQEITGKYSPNAEGILVNAAGEEYSGDHPYVTLEFDGKPRENLRKFTPHAATADELSPFVGGKGFYSAVIDSTVEAFKLFSDLKFNERAKELNEELQNYTEGTKIHTLTKKKRDAAAKNIVKDEFKITFPA